jgi:uncharacterized membrane protein
LGAAAGAEEQAAWAADGAAEVVGAAAAAVSAAAGRPDDGERSGSMNIGRAIRHLLTPAWRVRRVLPPAVLARIEQAIRASEAQHRGEIRFAVEASLDLYQLFQHKTARSRAVQVFSDLRVWDTEENNGVLIYLLLADRDFEIVADRGIHRRIGNAGWEELARRMERHFRAGNVERGVIEGIEAVGRTLQENYPRRGPDINELPDRPAVI